jgi:F-type H+-transporting ATPase subunit gamma
VSGERLSDVRARIVATRQLETVFTAMRGLAAARSREAQSRLEGARAYARALGEAIGAALSLAPQDAPMRAFDSRGQPSRHVVLVFCAEQGFAGAFSERILDVARRLAPRAPLYLVGERGRATALEQQLDVAWSTPMPAHVENVPLLAERIAETLYDRLASDETTRVSLVHGVPAAASEGAAIVARPLIPLDLARFPAPARARAPLVNLAPTALIESLAQEYVFAELCEAAVLSYAAENEARMLAMTGARNNVRRTLDELTARHRRLRQEQITEEIIELARR